MKRNAQILLGEALLVAVFLIGFAVWKYAHQLYNALDLAIYTQTAWNLIHSHTIYNTIQGSSYFGDHIELLLFPVALAFKLIAHPLTLVGIQILVLVSGIFPVYAIAKRHTSERISLLIASLYILHPLVWNIALFEFHFLVFAVPILLWLIYAYTIKSYKLFLFFLVLALCVREDVALAVFGMGLLALFDKRSWRWWLVPFVSSLAWFASALALNSHFADHGYKFSIFYSWLGNSIPQMAQTIFYHPFIVLSHLITLSNVLFPVALLLLFVGLPLKGMRGLIPTVLIFLQFVFGLFNVKTLLITHYTALLIPFLFYASILGVKKIQTEMRERKIRMNKEYKTLTMLISICVLVVNFFAIGPITGLFARTSHMTNELAERIPADASVVASYNPITTVSARAYTYSLHYLALGHKQFSRDPYPFASQPDYVLLDLEDLTTFEMQYANNPAYQNDYATMPERLRKFFHAYAITARSGSELLLSLRNDNTPPADENLAEVHVKPKANFSTFTVEQMTEDTNAQFGNSLIVQITITVPDANTWRTLGLHISYNTATGEKELDAPIAWHLYAMDDTSIAYHVKMRIFTDSFADAGTPYAVSLVTRKGQLQIASHRGTQTTIDAETTLANTSFSATH